MATLELSSAWAVVTGTSAIMAIGVAFLRARKFVDERISESLAKDEIIQRLSLLVKPDMVFDEHGSVIADRGACAFIQERGIQIKRGSEIWGPVPSEIRIAFSKHFKAPPLLTSLNPESVFIRAKRGESHDWIFELTYAMTHDNDALGFTRNYRLEIL